MLTHPFWGIVEESWAGMAPQKKFDLPGFEQPVEVFLGEELFEADEEYDLSLAQLDEYAATFQAFIAEAPRLLPEFQQQTFARYQELYASFYEDPAQSGAPALHLRTPEEHFAYLQDVAYLRITEGQTLRLSIRYGLNPEHGLEIRFEVNQLAEMGGIAET
ncbi:hypothetical protein K3G63_03720 [Hymenobacter sp. HSC-4F20]|uniref:DUF6985 domain-containing protein n=1 Tax=Hymenobacter sp. HSC-4F20 TaxID=2864135 RepID=UPI001C72A092|nr:hypothetical protein [Hymenobacter sp. HSC-4F20]MBX0289529.1 hypothetical protein [Hymenobacter sp. HSC-4F20]